MPEDRPHRLASAPFVAPDDVTRRTFTTAFRGYDQSEVRSYLRQVAEQLQALTWREEELHRQLREARDRIARPQLDEESLTAALGQEAARVLHSAHEAAGDIRRKAEENAARVLREAHDEAEAIRAAAESVLGERTTAAEAAAGEIRSGAAAEADALLAKARREADGMLDEARSRCEALAQDAEQLRARVLGELMRRRRVMHAQVEQLGAGRESLLRAVADVHRLLGSMEESLERVEGEAKAEADAAFRRALEEPEPALAELRSLAGMAVTREPAGVAPEAGATADPGPVSGPTDSEPAPADATAEATPVPAAAGQPGGAPDTAGPGPAIRLLTSTPEAAEGEPSTPSEERRGSSLRILRRGSRGDGERRHPSVAETGPSTIDEGIRIIRPSGAGEPPAVEEPALPEVAEPVSAPADALPEESAPPADGRSDGVEVQPAVAANGTGAAAEDAREALSGAAEPKASVDELFARIRAEREVSRQQAEKALEGVTAPGAPAEAATPTEGATAEPPAEAAAAERPAEADAGQPAPAAGSPAGEPGAVEPGAVEVDATGALDPVAEQALGGRARVLGPIQDKLARKLKRALQDDQNDVLDRIRNSTRGRRGSVLPGNAEHARRFADAAVPLLTEAFRAGGGFAVELVEGASPAEADLAPVAASLARAVVEPLRKRLATSVKEAGSDESATVDAVGAAYRSWKGGRINSLAMDGAVDAFERGVLAAVPAATPLRWVVDDDGGPCPDCDDNGLAGPTPAGEEYPTGQAHPPAHPGCRCLLAPPPA